MLFDFLPSTKLVFLIFLVLFISCCHGKVLLVSFDGFRWKYLEDYRNETSWFWELKKNGTSAKFGKMEGTFTTKTFPSHVTIATGLFEESHGIVSNVMFDPKFNATFSYKNKSNAHEERWWSSGEPIWITAEKQGKKSATYFWPGSEVPYHGFMQSIWKRYDKSVPFKSRVDTAVNWLAKEDVEFATIYFNEPDTTGHRFGPNSKEIRKAISNCNDVLGYLIKKLREERIYQYVDIIVVSDHGMAECSKSRIIPIYEDLEKRRDLYSRIVNLKGPVIDIVPKDGSKDELYQYLQNACKKYKGVKVYKKEDLPELLHYKNNRRIADILLIADEGFSIMAKYSLKVIFLPE